MDAEESDVWAFSSLVNFTHKPESYSLEANFYVDRESLLSRNRNARLVMRTRLVMHDEVIASVKALKDVKLDVRATTGGDAADATRTYRDLDLRDDGECVVEFAVPPNTRHISFDLSADVILASTSARQNLSASHSVDINGIDAVDRTRDMFIRKLPASVAALTSAEPVDGAVGTPPFVYAVFVLGKTGEPVEGVELTVDLVHRWVQSNQRIRVMTDENGRVLLGALTDYERVTVSGSSLRTELDLDREMGTVPRVIHTSTDEEVQAAVPWRPAVLVGGRLGSEPLEWNGQLEYKHCCLYKTGAGGIRLDDYFENLAYDAGTGMLTVGSLPEGSYSLELYRPYPTAHEDRRHEITIIVMEAARKAIIANVPHLLSGGIALQTSAHASPLQIASIAVRDGRLRVKVSGGSRSSQSVRVHCVASHLSPHWNLGSLGQDQVVFDVSA